jgi:hypothetical protein
MNPSHREWMISNTRPCASIGFGSFVTFWVEMSKPLWYDGIPMDFEFRDDGDVEG